MVFAKRKIAIIKMIRPNSKGQIYFTLKIAKILYKLYKILRNLNIFTKVSPNISSWHMKD
jgi:hypothetical protein